MMKRREFLDWSVSASTAAVTAGLVGCSRETARAPSSLPILDEQLTWSKAPCRF